MKIRPAGAEMFRADSGTDGRTDGRTGRQTDMTKLMVAFRNFANAPKMADLCGKIIPDYTAPYKKQ
jgi:hypothetical protein